MFAKNCSALLGNNEVQLFCACGLFLKPLHTDNTPPQAFFLMLLDKTSSQEFEGMYKTCIALPNFNLTRGLIGQSYCVGPAKICIFSRTKWTRQTGEVSYYYRQTNALWVFVFSSHFFFLPIRQKLNIYPLVVFC